jgi:two-component system phosphate regulon sensor histidine kinase PhoR
MLFRRPQHFPKQLFMRFLQQQVLVVVPAILIIAVAARVYLEHKLSSTLSVQDAVNAFDIMLLFLALVIALAITGISIWTGYRLVLPLGRVLVKARQIQKREYSAQNKEDGDESGDENEWADLESALNRIGRNMQHQERSLSREREEIEAIISAISEAVVATDKSGNVLFFNSQFAVLFGDRELQKRQSRLSDFFRNPDVLSVFRTTLKAGAPESTTVAFVLKGESAPRHFILSVAPLKITADETYGAVGVFHDVTELKRMDQVRIDFVANVSHELRTPLTSIKGYAETLRQDLQGNENAQKFLGTIERNTDRLIALVQDLLSLSALESGGTDLEKEEIKLRDLTDRVQQQLEPLRKNRNVQVHARVDAPILWADAKRLEQVLFNLLENALKYTPEGSRVEIAWEQDHNDVRLHVADNGPGIPVEHHARIFERFYRVDSARNREQGGTGLGLAIVKHIVQRHGGKLRVQGGLGAGTEFICSFPSEH